MTDCIEWTMARDKDGYALGSFHGRMRRWSRVVLEQKLGRPLLPRMCALHTCDNPPCINPDHLWEGTVADNNRDKAEKGRASHETGRVKTHCLKHGHPLTPDNVMIRWNGSRVCLICYRSWRSVHNARRRQRYAEAKS